MKAIVRVRLNEMPFDKADSTGFGLVHATGFRCKLQDGTWRTEYEDGIYEDADGCEYAEEGEE